MEEIELTQSEFDAIETNKTGVVATKGLQVKKPFGESWLLLTYGESDEDGNFHIDVKRIVVTTTPLSRKDEL